MKTKVDWTIEKEVDSTAIEKVWYHQPTRTLFLKWKGAGGGIAGYGDVSPIAVRNMFKASSIGSYANQHIKFAGYKGVNSDHYDFSDSKPNAVKAGSGTWANSVTYAPVAPVQAKPKKNFQVTGTVLKPTTVREIIAAESLEDAIAQFRAKHADKEPEVSGVAAY